MKRIFLSAALVLLAAGANAVPIVVTIDPVPTDPKLGSEVVMNVEVSTNGSEINDYSLFLSFDDTILDYVGTLFDDPFNGIQDAFLDAVFFGPYVDLSGFFVSYIGNNIPLFDVTFEVIGTCMTDLFLDGAGNEIIGFPLFGVQLTASVDAVAVPETGTLALFGMGLLGLRLARRRNV